MQQTKVFIEHNTILFLNKKWANQLTKLGGGGGGEETQGRWAKRLPKEWAKLLGDETTRGETTQGEQGIGRNDTLPVQIPNAPGLPIHQKV